MTIYICLIKKTLRFSHLTSFDVIRQFCEFSEFVDWSVELIASWFSFDDDDDAAAVSVAVVDSGVGGTSGIFSNRNLLIDWKSEKSDGLRDNGDGGDVDVGERFRAFWILIGFVSNWLRIGAGLVGYSMHNEIPSKSPIVSLYIGYGECMPDQLLLHACPYKRLIFSSFFFKLVKFSLTSCWDAVKSPSSVCDVVL